MPHEMGKDSILPGEATFSRRNPGAKQILRAYGVVKLDPDIGKTQPVGRQPQNMGFARARFANEQDVSPVADCVLQNELLWSANFFGLNGLEVTRGSAALICLALSFPIFISLNPSAEGIKYYYPIHLQLICPRLFWSSATSKLRWS